MENLLIIEGQIKHAIDLLRDAKSNVESQHAIIQQQKQKVLNYVNVYNCFAHKTCSLFLNYYNL